MIVDASALVAVLLDEPEADHFVRRIQEAQTRSISPINFVEAAIKADDPRTPAKSGALDALMSTLAIVVVPISEEQARLARDAHRRYGRRHHPARLNLGDCFAYALAKARREPLLYKGENYSKTDIESAA